MFLEKRLLPMLTYILNRPLKNDKLVESIKKNQQFIEHDINSLLQLVYFYEQIVLNFNINNGISKIWNELENKYSLTLTKNGLSSILELHTIKVQIERIYDMLYLKKSGDKDIDIKEISKEYNNAINILRLNELLFLCISGVSVVSFEKNKIIFNPASNSKKRMLYATWFARNLENNSLYASIQTLLNSKNEDEIYRVIFDKIFRMNIEEFSDEVFELKTIDIILNVIKILMLCIKLNKYNKYFTENSYVTVELKRLKANLENYSIKYEDFKKILKLEKELLITEQFIFIKDEFFSINLITFFYGIRSFFSFLEEKYGEKSKRDKLIGGDFFENVQIRKRMTQEKSEYVNRFIFHDPIYKHDISDVEKNKKYDVEYIIQDKALNHYYFIQAKFSILGERGYFNGLLKSLNSDISLGLEQLRGVKEYLEQGKLYDLLSKRGLSNVTSENSSFILIHNIPQLDFQKSNDGIALYDWNTFRNLLKDGECTININPLKTIKLSNHLLLKDPYDVVDKLLKEHECYQKIKIALDDQINRETSFYLGEKEIIIKGLGI